MGVKQEGGRERGQARGREVWAWVKRGEGEGSSQREVWG